MYIGCSRKKRFSYIEIAVFMTLKITDYKRVYYMSSIFDEKFLKLLIKCVDFLYPVFPNVPENRSF
jgi:hypothetical protein